MKRHEKSVPLRRWHAALLKPGAVPLSRRGGAGERLGPLRCRRGGWLRKRSSARLTGGHNLGGCPPSRELAAVPGCSSGARDGKSGSSGDEELDRKTDVAVGARDYNGRQSCSFAYVHLKSSPTGRQSR